MHDQNRVGFIKDSETGKFCPVQKVADMDIDPSPKLFLENSTKQFVYVLQEIKEKPDA